MSDQGLEDKAVMASEHRVQLGLFRAFAQAIRNNAGDAEKAEILDNLIDYTELHFNSEQLLMRLHAYPGFDAHIAEHDGLMADVKGLRSLIEAGDEAAGLDLVDKLETWLVQHIDSQDKAFGRFLDGR